ncbi:MAG: hypothetical protein ACK41Y_16410, partial [Paracoccus hibiscisoli]|uniref:hypothetical protein n=1 Tax=Paracoccus hibiscisoli TaxID=2023261 RepID=UPI00391C54D8
RLPPPSMDSRCTSLEPAAHWVVAAAGYGHSGAVDSEGRAWSWGWGSLGQLGRDAGAGSGARPVLVSGLTGQRVVALDCGWAHTAVVTGEPPLAARTCSRLSPAICALLLLLLLLLQLGAIYCASVRAPMASWALM